MSARATPPWRSRAGSNNPAGQGRHGADYLTLRIKVGWRRVMGGIYDNGRDFLSSQ